MTQEREQIQQLEARQQRLSKIMEKRVDPSTLEPHITRRLGDTFERDLKVGIVNNKLRTSYERIDTELTDIQTRLDSRGDELVSSAQTYLDETAVRNAQLSQLRRLLATNDIPQDVYNRREAQFRELELKGQSNPDLKRGIEIIEERERERERLAREIEAKTPTPQEPQAPVEPKVERPVSSPEQREAELPEIKIDWRNRAVTLDGRNILFSTNAKIAWPVFMHLAKNANSEVTYDEIRRIALKAGSASGRSSADTIDSIRDIIERDPSNPKFVESIGASTTSRYRLNANVEFVGEKSKMEISDDRIVFEGEKLNLTERQAKVLRVLARNVDQQVLSRNLSQEAFGNPNTQETNLRDSIRQLKRILNRDDIPDVVFSSGQAAEKSWSALKGVNVVGEDAKEKEETPAVSDVDKVPVSAEIELTEEQKAKNLRNLAIVEGMVAEGLLPLGTFDEARIRVGDKILQKAEVPVRKPHANEYESKEFELPDGQIVNVNGPMRIKAFEHLIKTSQQEQLSSEELSILLYGDGSDGSRARVSALVTSIRNFSLKDMGWEITQPVSRADLNKGEKGKYYLRKIGEEASEAETVSVTEGPVEESNEEVSTDLPETEEIASNGQPIQPEEPGSTQAMDQPQLIEVPYEPLPEEIRSKEENLVLRTIIDYRTSHSRFNFEAIQIALASLIEERRATDLEGTHFRIYRAYELKELYRSAMSKLSKDIAAERSGAELADDDKILWTKVEALAERLTSNRQDMTRLNQVISREIDSAEREFYDLNPDLRGKDWIV